MSHPFQPQPGQPHQPGLGQQPPQMQPQYAVAPPPAGKPPKKKRFGFLALGLSGLAGLLLGGAAFGAGDDTTVTAAPAPTVTVKATATVTEPAAASEPTEVPAPEPEPTTEEPAAYKASVKDWKVAIKVTDKQCFGSAGCNVTYKIDPEYVGSQPLPDEGKIEVTYDISGAEDEIIGSFTVEGGQASFDGEEIAQTSSSSKSLKAKITDASYDEFG